VDPSGGVTGVPLGQVTELCGLPGVGKTQMAMQLCLDVQFPSQLGGCMGGAVFVDTEGSLLPPRLRAMASKVEEHMSKIVDKNPEKISASGGPGGAEVVKGIKERCSAGVLLANVAHLRVTSLAGLLDCVERGLPALLQQRAAGAAAAAAAAAAVTAPAAATAEGEAEGSGSSAALLPVKLVVLDSLAFHFRASDMAGGERNRRLAGLGAELLRLAAAHGCAILVTNHLVTSQREGEGSAAHSAAAAAAAAAPLGPKEALAAALDPDTSRMVPALGDAWAHFPSLRLLLKWERGRRVAVLLKSLLAVGGSSSSLEQGGEAGSSGAAGGQLLPPAPFCVGKEGIRGETKRAKKAQ